MNNKLLKIIYTLSISIAIGSCSLGDTKNYAQYVNCFVGTDGPGNTYPGSVVPFGMVQLSPDNGLPGWDRIAGYYWQDSTIAGFSHKHLTGTGAGDLYDILVLPFNSRFKDDLWPDLPDYRPFSYFSHDKEEASPGYYKVDLLSFGITAELTATERVGIHRYTFPQSDSSAILVDLGYSLNWDRPTKTFLKQEDDYTLVGYRYSTGWANDQREFFVVKFSKPMQNMVFYRDNQSIKEREVQATKTKMVAYFETTQGETVQLKVALSSHSIEGARKNLIAETKDLGFTEIRQKAHDKWNKQLGRIDVEGTQYQKELFYTNLYHCFLTPSLHSDVDGWYKGADGAYHQAQGYSKYETFSLWDTYRTAHPLYTIIAPQQVKDFIASFLSHYKETGLLPVWSMAGNETNMMIGYHAVPVIVDAYFKGIPMDVELAYEASKKTAMSNAWALPLYKKYGYVPSIHSKGEEKENWSVSKTIEYAYDDWCLAQFAYKLKKEEDSQYFLNRSRAWMNLYDSNSQFLRPKTEEGHFVSPFLAKEYTEDYCESNAWQYFWAIQHDIDTLINILGKEVFLGKLDSMFSYYPEPTDKLPLFSTGMIGQYAHGNEPSHHVAYLYNRLDKPQKTQHLTLQIINNLYSVEPDGFCGNEDCGQMSAWMVTSSLGLYPVNPANGIYDLTTPWVDGATIHLPDRKKFYIEVENGPSSKNRYIKQILLNGKPYDKWTLTHQELVRGGKLTFILESE